MIRRPPRSTLFPTRRSSDLGDSRAGNPIRDAAHHRALARLGARQRSEEHTSELQSRENLVCRLLLEKKKRKMSEDNTKDCPIACRIYDGRKSNVANWLVRLV